MISIDKTKVQKPIVLNEKWIEKKLVAIRTEQQFGKGIKNKYNDATVRTALMKLYHGKCAYCEAKIPEGYAERIDHYRPKDGIGRGQNKLANHKGYYWLGYEWTNLLPTCEKCNGTKSNKFPLSDEQTRVSDDLETEGFLVQGKFVFNQFKIDSDVLQREKRLLLNPEIDKVEYYLYFKPTGEISPNTIGFTQGKTSIELYGLDRSLLILARKTIVESLINEIVAIFNDYGEKYSLRWREFFNTKVRYFKSDEYSRFRFFIMEFFDLFIVEPLRKLGFIFYSKILNDHYKRWRIESNF